MLPIGAARAVPGEKKYIVEDSLTVPVDVKSFSVAAHAHYIGKEIKVTATLPDGTTQPLLPRARGDRARGREDPAHSDVGV